MIKVISTNPHASVVKEVVCKNCGSTLQYTPADVLIRHWTDYSGDSNAVEYISCPTCSKEVKLIPNYGTYPK